MDDSSLAERLVFVHAMPHPSTPVETQNSLFLGSAIVTQRVGPYLRMSLCIATRQTTPGD